MIDVIPLSLSIYIYTYYMIYIYRRKGLQIWAYQIVQATILFNSRFPSYNKQHIQLDPSINFGDISTVQTDGLLISDLSSLVPWLHGSICTEAVARANQNEFDPVRKFGCQLFWYMNSSWMPTWIDDIETWYVFMYQFKGIEDLWSKSMVLNTVDRNHVGELSWLQANGNFVWRVSVGGLEFRSGIQ